MISAKAVISVPFYNEVRFLEETLSCLKKIPPDTDVKFFLCNNCSDDGSKDIAEKFAAEDDRFVLHTHDENIGAFQNFQFAFEKSDSDYFMWLGAHDLIDPGYAVSALQAFEERPEISYAAGEPCAFKDKISENKLMADGKYENFHDNRLMRYIQSVGQLNNCTIVNSMFRRSYAKAYKFRHTISWDHVFISHLLWHGPIHYVKSRKYYRRFFDDHTGTREEKLLGEKQKKKPLPRCEFIDFYSEDFLKLYQGPEHTKRHAYNKILDILEKRFGMISFDYDD